MRSATVLPFSSTVHAITKTDAYTDPVTGLVIPRTIIAKAPVSTAAAGVFYKHGPIRFSLTDKWTGAQYSDLSNTTRISPYNTANLGASYDIGPLRVGIDVTDLFGSEKINQISGTQIYYQPGRAISGQVTYNF